MRVGSLLHGGGLTDEDRALLDLTAAYVAAAVRTGEREDRQAASLAELADERAGVEQHASALHAAIVRHGTEPAGLRVFALGPLRVERGGRAIERWGGDKAGSRQAEGLFAFLLDRGERGVAKDEALDLIWPDVDVDRGDMAFHRTLVGLRRTLDAGTGRSAPVRFHNDRYRLDPGIVEWSDVAEFQGRLDAAAAAPAPDDRRLLLEQARALYRGDYLDDCPFYGDGPQVEERRVALRARHQDLLLTLGESYELAGDRLSAAAAYREAIQGADEPHGQAEAALARLGL
jgi:two-component SAPR family response regulator